MRGDNKREREKIHLLDNNHRSSPHFYDFYYYYYYDYYRRLRHRQNFLRKTERFANRVLRDTKNTQRDTQTDTRIPFEDIWIKERSMRARA